MGYPTKTFVYHFYCLEKQSLFVMRMAVFIKDEYLLRIDSRIKVFLEEFPNRESNATSLDKEKIHEHVHVHLEVSHKFDTISRQLDQYVGHIFANDVVTRHLKDSDSLTYDEVVNDSNSKI